MFVHTIHIDHMVEVNLLLFKLDVCLLDDGLYHLRNAFNPTNCSILLQWWIKLFRLHFNCKCFSNVFQTFWADIVVERTYSNVTAQCFIARFSFSLEFILWTCQFIVLLCIVVYCVAVASLVAFCVYAVYGAFYAMLTHSNSFCWSFCSIELCTPMRVNQA